MDSPSPYGAYDMAGNVWEPTASWYDSTEDKPVLRGGSGRSTTARTTCCLLTATATPPVAGTTTAVFVASKINS